MAETPISADAAESDRIKELTGIDEPARYEEPIEETPEPKEEPKPEPKTEEAEETEEEESEDEAQDEEPVRSTRPNKSERPIKALFTQVGELRKAIEALSKSPAKTEAIEAVDEIKALAEKRGLDAEGLAEIVALLQKNVEKNLTGKLKPELPADIQEKLAALDKIQAEQKVKEETIHFESEWNTLLTEIKKQYPNAGQAEIMEAKKVMDELSHSKEYHKFDLDYVMFKNRPKFDTLLKIAKSQRSSEGASKQIEEYDEDSEIDIDPESTDPEKMKAYERQRLHREQKG